MGILDNNVIQTSIYEATRYLLESGDLDTFEDQVKKISSKSRKPGTGTNRDCICDYIVIARSNSGNMIKLYIRTRTANAPGGTLAWTVYTVRLQRTQYTLGRKAQVFGDPNTTYGLGQRNTKHFKIYGMSEPAADTLEMLQQIYMGIASARKMKYGDLE